MACRSHSSCHYRLRLQHSFNPGVNLLGCFWSTYCCPPRWDLLGEADWSNVKAELLSSFTHVQQRHVQHWQPDSTLSPVLHDSLLPLAVWVLRTRNQRSEVEVVVVEMVVLVRDG